MTDSANSQEASADCGRQGGTESEIWMLWKQLVLSHIKCGSGVCESAGEMYRNCYLCLKQQKLRNVFQCQEVRLLICIPHTFDQSQIVNYDCGGIS